MSFEERSLSPVRSRGLSKSEDTLILVRPFSDFDAESECSDGDDHRGGGALSEESGGESDGEGARRGAAADPAAFASAASRQKPELHPVVAAHGAGIGAEATRRYSEYRALATSSTEDLDVPEEGQLILTPSSANRPRLIGSRMLEDSRPKKSPDPMMIAIEESPEPVMIARRAPSKRHKSRIATLGREMFCTLMVPTEGSLPDVDLSVPTEWKDNGPERRSFFGGANDSGIDAETQRVEQRRRAVAEVERMAAALRSQSEEKALAMKAHRSRRKCRTETTLPSHMLLSTDFWSNSTTGTRASSKDPPQKDNPSRHQPVIIFDWDDTLLPTWYITEVVNVGEPSSTYGKLPEDSPFLAPLAAHAEIVKETLIAARQLANVAIVTLGARGWVDNSSDWFLPGVDIKKLLKDLNIPVYYARDHVSKSDRMAARAEEGVDLYMIAKRNAMKKCLKKFHAHIPDWQSQAHVISVGDSPVELEAVKEIMWDGSAEDNLVKAIKLMDDPTLDMLGMQLRLLCSWFPKVIEYEDDAYISMDNTATTGDLAKLFMAVAEN